MHLALELDQSKQVSADPKRDLDLALTVLRKRIDEFGVDRAAGPEGGRRPDRGRAGRHHRPGPRQGDRPAERLPRVPDHRQDQRARQGAARDGPRAARAGRQGRDTGAGKPSAVEQLLGGDSAKKPAAAPRRPPTKPPRPRPRPATPTAHAADTTPVAGGVLAGADPAGRRGRRHATPGEYVVPETAFPRVDSLLNLPAVARQLPRGVVLRWAAAPTSVGVQSVPLPLRARRPADHHRQQPGGRRRRSSTR